ncbi:MAG: hypothetical protein ACLRW4_13220 [Ruminococcus sp.]
MNYSDLITLILTQLRTHVNSDQFLEQFRRSKAFVRHRKLTLKQVVAYLIYSKSAQWILNCPHFNGRFHGISFPMFHVRQSPKPGVASCRNLFKELLMNRLKTVCKHAACSKAGFGYRVFAVDGSTLEIPLSNDTSSEFGTITSCNNQDICWVEGLLSTIYDVFLDQIVDGQIYTKGTVESADPSRGRWTRNYARLDLAPNAAARL